MEAGASWPLVQPMVRESWVDAVFGTLAQDKFSLGGRESEVSVNSRASGGRSAVVFYPCPGDQIPTNQQLDEGKDEGECPPLLAALASSPRPNALVHQCSPRD